MKRQPLLILLIVGAFWVQAQNKQQVLDYLYSISGKQIIAGQHNKEPNAEPTKWTDYIYETTGKYPALWSGDFLFQQENIDNRWKMIKEAEKAGSVDGTNNQA